MERYAFRYRYDVTSTVYTFTDKPATVTHTHTASGKDSRTEAYTYSYDHADRLSKVEHTLGGAKVTLAAYAYDNLGRLQSKSLHGSDADRQAYAYNVRGWLTGISGTKFTQNLYYNTGNGPAKYNGSISSMTWKAGTASTVRGYKSTYDGLDRLLNATYGETAGISTNANRFSENVTGYDKNGNIKGLQRYGQTGASAYGLLDNLTFTLNGNQLSRVEDAVSTAAYGTNTAFVNGASAAGEYAYDVNGNLTKDLNKGITDIQYNVLNLPSTVSFSDGSTITYTYGADGTKLRTVHKIGSTTTTTDYCGNVIYENGTQKLLLTEEGYINLAGTQQYHYYRQDIHQKRRAEYLRRLALDYDSLPRLRVNEVIRGGLELALKYAAFAVAAVAAAGGAARDHDLSHAVGQPPCHYCFLCHQLTFLISIDIVFSPIAPTSVKPSTYTLTCGI